jgi:hypothetical protein
LSKPHDFAFSFDTHDFIDVTSRQFDQSYPRILVIPWDDERITWKNRGDYNQATHFVRFVTHPNQSRRYESLIQDERVERLL